MTQPIEMSLEDRIGYFKEIELETQLIVVTEPSDAVKIAAIQAGNRHPPPDQTQGTYWGLVNEDDPTICQVKVAVPGHGIRFFGLREILAVDAIETEEQQAYRQVKLYLDAILEDEEFLVAMAQPLVTFLVESGDSRAPDSLALRLIRNSVKVGRAHAERMQKQTALAARTRAPADGEPDSDGSARPSHRVRDERPPRTGDDVMPGPSDLDAGPTENVVRQNPANTNDVAYEEDGHHEDERRME